MSDQYRDAINEEAGALWAEQVIRLAEFHASAAWADISAMLQEFEFNAVYGVINDRITVYTDPVLFAQSVEELALYIELTGKVPADREILFDFGSDDSEMEQLAAMQDDFAEEMFGD